MHELGMEWPSLSFDIVPDTLGFMRKTWPQTISLVAGSQAADPNANRISVMRITNITETKHDDEEDDDEDDDDESTLPTMSARFIKQRAAVNRIRVMPQSGSIVASWSEDTSISIHNVAPILRSMEDPSKQHDQQPIDWKPVAQFTSHAIEGYAVAWSPLVEGLMATGDCGGSIHLWVGIIRVCCCCCCCRCALVFKFITKNRNRK
jgi:ribosome assembly protein RRB1